MAEPEQDESFVDRISRTGEEALGRIAEELIANPVVNGAIARAFEAREKALQAQEAALGALNLPSAADIERVTRRLRSLSQRLEGIEDAIDRLEERVGAASRAVADDRLAFDRGAPRRDRARHGRCARRGRARRGARSASPGASDGHRVLSAA